MFDFKYTQDPEAETPLMFIDKEIGGKDADGNPNIQGNEFMKELLYLSDTLGKKNISVWINSPGGIVTEGQAIYTAILKSKANVDTYCYGIAASIAGVIFQGGRKRTMTPSSTLMYHPAWSDDGKEDKGLLSANKTVCTMISERTNKTYDEVWAIMDHGKKDDKGTWMDADYACANGFADIKDSGFDRNALVTSTRSIIAEYYNKTLEKPKIMTEYKNLNKAMGLNEAANEAAALEVFNNLNAKIVLMEKNSMDLQSKYDKALADCNSAKDALDKFNTEKAAADTANKAALKDAEDKAALDKANAISAESEEVMKNAVALGKIKNDATLIASYKSMYIKDPAATKAVIEALPGNKTSATFNKATDEELKDSDGEKAARQMGLKPGTAAWYNAVKLNSFK